MATQAELARHLHVARQTVSKLKNAGVLPPASARGGYDLDTCRGAYIRHLQAAAGGRDSSRPGSLESERARLANEQADLLSRKNALERGELIPAAEVDANVRGFIGRLMAFLDLLPPRLAPNDYVLRKRIEAELNDARMDFGSTPVVDSLVHPRPEEDEDEDDDDEE